MAWFLDLNIGIFVKILNSFIDLFLGLFQTVTIDGMPKQDEMWGCQHHKNGKTNKPFGMWKSQICQYLHNCNQHYNSVTNLDSTLPYETILLFSFLLFWDSTQHWFVSRDKSNDLLSFSLSKNDRAIWLARRRLNESDSFSVFSIKKSKDLIGWFLLWREKKLSRNLGDVKVNEISFEFFEDWLVN